MRSNIVLISLVVMVIMASGTFAQQTQPPAPPTQPSAQPTEPTAQPAKVSSQSLISIELRDTPVRSAIDSLFKGTGINYAIEAGVEGVIPNLSLKDVTLDQALKTLTKAAGLTYRKDGQVYLISIKKSIEQTTIQPVAQLIDTGVEEPVEVERKVEKVPLNYADAIDIAGIFGGSAYSSRSAALAYNGGYNSSSGGSYGGYSGNMGNMGNMGNFGSGSYGSGSYGGSGNYGSSYGSGGRMGW